MSKKDVVKEAIAHREVFPVPYYIFLSPSLANRLMEHFYTNDLPRSLGAYVFYTTVVPVIPNRVVNGSYTDIFGIRWDGVGETRGHPKKHPLEKPSLEGYSFPEPCPSETLQRIEKEIEPYNDLYIVVKLGDLFERAHFLRGMPELMVDMYRNPSFVEELFHGITEYNLGVIDRLASLKIDGLWLSDDYGSQKSLLLSRHHWRRFIKPHLQAIIQGVHGKGFHFILHSDGAIADLVPEIIEIGVDVIHPLQSECMDVASVKRRYGDEFTIFGGIGSQSMLLRETPEKIARRVRSICKKLGKGGGFILCPGLQITNDVTLENALAFIDAARRQNR